METGSVLDLYVPSSARSGITPHAIIALPRPGAMELLLCYDSQSIHVVFILKWIFFTNDNFDRRRGVCELYRWTHQGYTAPMGGNPLLYWLACNDDVVTILTMYVFCTFQLWLVILMWWVGAARPLRSGLWRMASLMECSCTKELKNWDFSVRKTTRFARVTGNTPSLSIYCLSPSPGVFCQYSFVQ